MKDTIPCKEMTNTDAKNNKRIIREEQKAAIRALFIEASKITEETPQREICALLSKTANYILKNKHYISDARQLSLKLSNCLKSKCDKCSWGFSELSVFIDESGFLD